MMLIISRIACFGVAVVALLGQAPIAGAAGPTAALEATARFRLESIEAVLRQAIADDKDFLAARRRLAAAVVLEDIGTDKVQARAFLALKYGNFAEATRTSRYLIEHGGMTERPVGHTLGALASLMGDDIFGAIRAYEAAAAEIPSWNGWGIEIHGVLAHLYTLTGQIDKAATSIEQAAKVNRYARSLSYGAYWEGQHLSALYRYRGYLSYLRGNLPEAERELRDSVREYEQYTPLRRQFMERFPTYRAAAGPDELYYYGGGMSRAWLGLALSARGKGEEGLFNATNGLMVSLRTAGYYSPSTASFLLMLSQVFVEQGRNAEAERLLRHAEDILVRLAVAPGAAMWTFARQSRARALIGMDRYREALELLRAIESDRAKAATTGAGKLQSFPETHFALLMTGNNAEAAARLAEAIPEYEARLGAEHVFLAPLRAMHGLAQVRAGGNPEAGLGQVRGALAQVVEQGASDTSPFRQKVIAALFELYAELLAERGQVSAERMEELFRMTDLLRNQGAQRALRAAATRAKVADPELADLIRRQQDRENELEALTRIAVDLAMRPAGQQLPKVVADMQDRIRQVGKELTDGVQTIDRRFPAYAQLMRPRTPGFAELRKVLAPGEAFVSILPMTRRSFVWVLTRDGAPAMHVAKLGAEEIAVRVRRLRNAFVFDASGRPGEFHFDASLALFRDLLEPLMPHWSGSSMLTVTAAGALSQLPFSTLITAPFAPKGHDGVAYADHAAAPWLVRRAAIAEIPSASALVTLRQLDPGKANRQALVGFGDPEFGVLTSTEHVQRGMARNLSVSKAVEQAATAVVTVSAGVPGGSEAAVRADYGKIPPLPDTRDELLSIARAIGADPAKDLFLGKRATREAVMTQDLAERRIVAFATHGVLPGEFPGLDQPALAMANPGNGELGFLTASDVMGLKLDADWVILSACNTAAGDGQGAEAISGLGRSFFFAGGRALLATHWAVESESAMRLVSGIFERYAKTPGLSRARALQESILAMMNGSSADARRMSFAHPAFWAPYALIGDGATR